MKNNIIISLLAGALLTYQIPFEDLTAFERMLGAIGLGMIILGLISLVGGREKQHNRRICN